MQPESLAPAWAAMYRHDGQTGRAKENPATGVSVPSRSLDSLYIKRHCVVQALYGVGAFPLEDTLTFVLNFGSYRPGGTQEGNRWIWKQV